MAQAQLEEKFRSIGLAEATAKCGLYHLADLLSYHTNARRLSIHSHI